MIDVLKVWLAILPHMAGDWIVLDSRQDDTETRKRVRSIRVARNQDGAEIEIWPEFNQGKETRVRVRPATFYYSDKREYNNSINDKWLFNAYNGGSIPCAVIDITKRNATAIANDITRRVIEPTAAIMPKVRECQKQRADADARKASAVEIARKVPGVKVREHYNDKTATLVEFDGHYGSGTIRQGSTDVRFERLELPIEALAEFAELSGSSKTKGRGFLLSVAQSLPRAGSSARQQGRNQGPKISGCQGTGNEW